MKEEAKKAVKKYIRRELVRTRYELGVSRVEMGLRMGMTEWGYKDLPGAAPWPPEWRRHRKSCTYPAANGQPEWHRDRRHRP